MNTHKAKAYTVNAIVYRWACTHCSNKNATVQSELMPNKNNPDTRLATCSCCGTVTELEHHTFKRI